MTSRERVQTALNHKTPDILPIDFGSTAVTGIHCKVVESLRDYYGLEKHPIRIIDPFQMLGKVENDLREIIGVDTEGIYGRKNIFDSDETELHEQITPWGQRVMISKDIDLSTDSDGDVYIYPKGDRSTPPCAVMPSQCYFINAIERQDQVDDDKLQPSDNLEEYGPLSHEDLQYFVEKIDEASETNRALVASFGGAALGDVAFIPGMGLSEPKGIRSVVEWYMSTLGRKDYIHEITSVPLKLGRY